MKKKAVSAQRSLEATPLPSTTAPKAYTVEVWKVDKRVKQSNGSDMKKGFKLVYKQDTPPLSNEETMDMKQKLLKQFPFPLYHFFIFETMVEKTHAMTGEKFLERYDTPYYLSPSSETYWSS